MSSLFIKYSNPHLAFPLPLLLSDPTEHGRHGPHHPGGHRLQDQAGGPHLGGVANGHQRLLQRLLDGSRLQAHARLPQVRFLPDHVGRRWPAASGGSRARGRVHGREEKGVVRRVHLLPQGETNTNKSTA